MFKNIAVCCTDRRSNEVNYKDYEDDLNFNNELVNYSYSRIEALRYIAGYLAFKNKENKICSEEDIVENGWIETLSRGGLTTPSKEVLEMVEVGNKIFENIHGEEHGWLRKEGALVSNFHKTLSDKFPNIPTKLLRRFSRTRVFIRIKFLNTANKISSEEKRNKSKKKLLLH